MNNPLNNEAPDQSLQADACLVGKGAFLTAAELNPQVAQRLRVLAESPEFLPTVAFFRNNMNPELMRKIVELSGTLKDDPHGRQVLTLFKVDDLGPSEESNLGNLRAMMAEVDRLRARRPSSPKRSPVRGAKSG